MEWKEQYTRTKQPAYQELLQFFQPNVRELFLKFDMEMRQRFQVQTSIIST